MSEGGRGNPSVSPTSLPAGRQGKQAFAEGENVRNRGFLKSEPEASESERWHEVPERASD